MPDRTGGVPLFDVGSYARRGPGRRDRLSAPEIDQIRRTVGRTPEVMVKVLTRGATSESRVRRHAEYIGRRGEVDLETDDGQHLTGDDVGERLIADWNLDLPEAGYAERTARGAGRDTKLVHKLIFSMPPGTPPDKVLGAVRDFAREEFALQHRYALALHTDEPHPHVHLIVKAVSEQGRRLNIRKDTLRHWRAEFARQLRAQGVEANATERAVRGQSRKALTDAIYRADARGASWRVPTQGRSHAGDPGDTPSGTRAASTRLQATNEQIVDGYRALAEALDEQGERSLGERVRTFASQIDRAPTRRRVERQRESELDRSQRLDPTR